MFKAIRIDRVLPALLCAAPLCSIARLPPVPSFWSKWLAVVLALTWLITRALMPRQGVQQSKGVPLISACLAGLSLWLLLQTALQLPSFPVDAMVAAAILLLAAFVSKAAHDTGASGRANELLRSMAIGLLVALLLNGVAVLAGFAGWGVVPWEFIRQPVPTRAVGFIGQSNHLGTLAVVGWAAALWLWRVGWLPGKGAALLVVASSLICASTASRSALLGFALVSGVAAWHSAWRPQGWKGAWIAAVACFALVQFLAEAFRAIAADAALLVVRSGDHSRIEMIRDGLQLFWADPLVGVGHGNFGRARLWMLDGSMSESNPDHAHNLFAQAAAEWGVVGLLLVILSVGVLGNALIRRAPDPKSEAWFPAAFVLAVFVHSLFEYPLWLPCFLLPVAMGAALLPQPRVLVGRQDRSAAVPVVLLVSAFLALSCCLAAVDYFRSQAVAMEMQRRQVRDASKPAVTLEDTAHIAAGTLFPRAIAQLHARAMSLDPDFLDYKLEAAERALWSVNTAETKARYLYFLILSGRTEDVLTMSRREAIRSVEGWEETLGMLRALGSADQSMQSVVEAVLRDADLPEVAR